MKKLFIICFFLLYGLITMAQDFKIASVEYLPLDGTAINEKMTEPGNNGRECAVIRIATQDLTPAQRESFYFEPDWGSKVVQRAERDGEIWLWVSPGMQHLRIKGGKLGQDEVHFVNHGITIQSLKTYKIVLRGTERGNRPKDTTPKQQYLLFQLTPPSATLEVNNQLWKVEHDGTAKQYLDFGTYTYRVRAADYFTETGDVIVNDPNDTQIVKVTLRPNFATITLSVDADAEIWVNDEMKGKRRWTGDLGSGTYKVECRQASHETVMTTLKITPEMSGQTIALTAPTPIYGSLNVESTPNLATIYIDGKEVGKTPKSIMQILIGQHELKLTKEGFADYSESITITKNERKLVEAKMSEEKVISGPVAASRNGSDLIFTINGVSFTMKLVEGGSFQMGATSEQGRNAEGDEKPVHSVSLDNYYMGETEVTQTLWQAVMGSNPSYFKDDNHPVEQVSWNDCQEFIRKLNQKTGKNFRLPTEAEWEYAARGGKKSKSFKYAGSNTIGNVAWYTQNSNDITHTVKTKQPNELGLYDMCGNVWEWCQDWYAGDYYNKSSNENPQGPYSGSRRVLRGGSWYNYEGSCRVSDRQGNDPESWYNFCGFRLCLPK